MRTRKLNGAILAAIIIFAVLFLVPMLFSWDNLATSCKLNSAIAQDNPCLEQEASISAQKVQLLELQLTNQALQDAISTLQNNAEPIERLVTFVVVITTTPSSRETPIPATQSMLTPLPENCIPHVIEEGDTLFGIAELYGVNGFAMMAVNGLDENTVMLLQVGDVIIVPLEGCELEPPSTPEPAFTPAPLSSTITLAPTAANAQIEIIEVASRGDITAEAVRIRNLGETVNVTGWTISDSEGNVYPFPQDQLIFSNAEVTVYTRTGQNTPVVFFWGRDTAVWGEKGDVITIRDNNERVQATVRLP